MHLTSFRCAVLCAFAAFSQGVLSAPGQAHEFWIEPEAYVVDAGQPARAAFHVGQVFKGPTFIFVPGRSISFEQIAGGTRADVIATVGDDPAFQLQAAPDGLLIVAHEAAAQLLTYASWEKFQGFIDHKDFGDVRSAHLARGLPEEDFKEGYSRYSKALIGVGSAAGTDTEFGLRTEMIALANPYTDDVSQGFPILVLYEGAPRADTQVELFAKADDGTVDVTLHRTNADGIVTLPVQPGHSYLADAVLLLELDPATSPGGVAYHSLWAALTFAVP